MGPLFFLCSSLHVMFYGLVYNVNTILEQEEL